MELSSARLATPPATSDARNTATSARSSGRPPKRTSPARPPDRDRPPRDLSAARSLGRATRTAALHVCRVRRLDARRAFLQWFVALAATHGADEWRTGALPPLISGLFVCRPT